MKGRRITLRPVTAQDASLIHQWTARVVEDPSAAASFAGSLSQSVTHLEDALRDGEQTMLIILTPAKEPVGVLEWHWIGRPPVRTAEIGVSVGIPELWNLGYGADGFDALISHLFLSENAHRVQFSVSKSNVRMLQSLARPGGPVLEGIRREAAYLDGQYDDVLYFGILRHEFDQVLEVAPDLAARIDQRRELIDAAHQLVQTHLESTGDSAVQHLITGIVPDPLAERTGRS